MALIQENVIKMYIIKNKLIHILSIILKRENETRKNMIETLFIKKTYLKEIVAMFSITRRESMLERI